MTAADAEFAARMEIEAFREKYEWCAGKNK